MFPVAPGYLFEDGDLRAFIRDIGDAPRFGIRPLPQVHLLHVGHGAEGETAGRQLLDKGILQATIKSPDFGALAYDTALKILDGRETDRQMTVVPQLIRSDTTSVGLSPASIGGG